jgi:DMSO/TMAO reductase YedYZ molybdopterin-dependent catalytic subunit
MAGVIMKKRAIIGYAITGAIILAFIVTLVRLGPFHSKVTQLSGVEVTEYQGKDLSSVNDFRENSISGPQHINIADYTLNITGLAGKPASYTYDNVINGNALYKKVVRLNCVEGWAVNILWEGVQVRDILAKANPLPTAQVVIFHAYDGYTTSFPIDYIMNNPILMAYKMNDVIIPPERGYPFVLVAEDKWGYKWIKWITQIELSDDTSYQGFWESRGYSNTGDLNQDFLQH